MSELPSALQPAAANLIVTLADNKYLLAQRLATWGVGAPTLESAVACTAIAQEEAGHARGLYSLLNGFPEGMAPRPLEREDDRERRYALSYLVEPTTSFVRGVAALALADRAFTTVLEAITTSSDDALRKRAVRMFGDEAFHQRYADGRVRELPIGPIESQLCDLLPETLCWFGPEGEAGLDALVEAGVVRDRNETLRQTFLTRLAAVTDPAGINLPISRDRAGVWHYEELPWSQWNQLERRLLMIPVGTTQ